jgi:O-antigen/teichoic acid export membrane protein
MIAGFIATLVNNLYIALIGRYFSPASVGYFTQATSLSNALSSLMISTLQSVTYPIMTSIKNDKEKLLNIYKQLISITMLVSLPILVGFAAIADTFIRLFLGEVWMETVPILVALSLARAITPISAINLNILKAVGRSDLFLKVDLSKLPLTLGVLFLALPYGIEVIAWSMLFTSIVAFFINAYYPYKLFGFGAIQQLKVAFNYIVASGIMFFIIKVINLDATYLNLLFSILIGTCAYVSYLFIVRDNFFLKILNEIFIIIKRKLSI